MADHLVVDETLDDTNRDLKTIHQEFSLAKDRADQTNRIWGQDDLTWAMGEFVNNWYVHRDKINERLGKLSERVDQACQTWTDAEKQLADSIQVDEVSNA
ncbi:hypothetical protein ELQ92_02795 [Labedella populi]|uniref:Uncharacterized protein n=1 Tax=Labedella populi TaxID=2498850 RepID=A0A3S4CEN4_9MICO|nr:hypothetical protein [Labedella populi]RWZ68181.1 hypothetical protein ELQ92_02795 [Labedella populi]